jgi:DinB superfamily
MPNFVQYFKTNPVYMTRSQLNPVPEYFDRYINLTDDVDILTAIETSIDEIDRFPLDKWTALGDQVYAPGKWTIKEMLQHLIDTERVFTYRALAFARNETQRLPSFEEDAYVAASNAGSRSLDSLLQELRVSHQSFKALYESFTPEVLQRGGNGFKGFYSVAAIGFLQPGHQRWHLKVLEEKYYPLLRQPM